MDPLPMGWWMSVEETYCSHCKEMKPSYSYQGHFLCNICGKLTGFWLPISSTPFFNKKGVPDIEGVKTWNKEATKLLPVPFKMRGEDFVRGT